LTVARVVAYIMAVFLNVNGLILLTKPALATGPRGIPLLSGESRPMTAVLAAREIALGLISGGLAYIGDFSGLLVAFLIALIITIIDAVALLKTKSIWAFVINDIVGLMLLFAAYSLWKDLSYRGTD
jgi:hypothetical protein